MASEVIGDMDPLRADVRFEGRSLTDFTPASVDEVRKIILKSAMKSLRTRSNPNDVIKNLFRQCRHYNNDDY